MFNTKDTLFGKKEEAVKKQLGRILRTLKEKYGEY